MQQFQEETGIKVVYDVYDSNEVLEAKLLAGHSGYDLVFPTARPFAQRHIKAGIYRKVDKTAGQLRQPRPGDHAGPGGPRSGQRARRARHGGTTSMAATRQGERAPRRRCPGRHLGADVRSRRTSRLADCGISLIDDPTEVFSAALVYLGKDPNSTAKADLDAATALLQKVRPYIRYFHSSQYINDLANGDLCVVHGYSGDILQARDRAVEANNGVEVVLTIPREGALAFVDVMAIPADAPHPEKRAPPHRFPDGSEVIAKISGFRRLRQPDPGIAVADGRGGAQQQGHLPPPEVLERLIVPAELDPAAQRARTRPGPGQGRSLKADGGSAT